MKRFITYILYLTLSTSVTAIPRSGDWVGNGGEEYEYQITVTLKELEQFFKAEEIQNEFPEIDFNDFQEVISKIKPVQSKVNELKDQFGEPRCFRNTKSMIEFLPTCWKEIANLKQRQYGIIFHEILGILGVETAGKYIPSEYPVSSRIENFIYKIESYGLLNKEQVKIDAPLFINCHSLKTLPTTDTPDSYLSMELDINQNSRNISISMSYGETNFNQVIINNILNIAENVERPAFRSIFNANSNEYVSKKTNLGYRLDLELMKLSFIHPDFLINVSLNDIIYRKLTPNMTYIFTRAEKVTNNEEHINDFKCVVSSSYKLDTSNEFAQESRGGIKQENLNNIKLFFDNY